MKKTKIRLFLSLFTVFFISTSILSSQETLIKLKVVNELANLRLKPDIGSGIVFQAPRGTVLDSKGKEGEWFLVDFGPEEGEKISCYVHESLVVVIQGPEEGEEVGREMSTGEMMNLWMLAHPHNFQETSKHSFLC